MTPDWKRIAEGLGFASEAAMWDSFYPKFTLAQLAGRFGVSAASIRAAIAAAQPSSPRGSRLAALPKRKRIDLTLKEVRELQREGLAAAARRLGVSYYTLYTRISKALKAAYERQKRREFDAKRR